MYPCRWYQKVRGQTRPAVPALNFVRQGAQPPGHSFLPGHSGPIIATAESVSRANGVNLTMPLKFKLDGLTAEKYG